MNIEDQRDTLALLIHAQDYHEKEARHCEVLRLRDVADKHRKDAAVLGARASALSDRITKAAATPDFPGAMP